jgi:hypothetical protein
MDRNPRDFLMSRKSYEAHGGQDRSAVRPTPHATPNQTQRALQTIKRDASV